VEGHFAAWAILSTRSGGSDGPGLGHAPLGDPMTEILTESFCERCGTRYTFESARPRARLKGVKVLSRGLKNFVLSDETSMDEAMAAARSDTDREATAYQLDAFHKTFNFCMQCRQYTCPNCWNEAEVRCLTCAPHLGNEVLPAPFPDLPVASVYLADAVALGVADGANGSNGWHDMNGATDPDDGGFDLAARLAALTEPVTPDASIPTALPETRIEAAAASPVVEPVATAPVVEPVVIRDLPVEAAPEPATEAAAEALGEPVVTEEPLVSAWAPEPAIGTDPVDHEAAERLAALGAAAIVADAITPETDRTIGDKITGQTTGLLKRFRPVQSLDAELDAYELAQAAPAAAAAEPMSAAQPEPVVGAAPDVTAAVPEVTREPEPEMPVAPEATVAKAPEVAAPAEVAAEPEVITTAPTPPSGNDIVAQPTWRMVAPDPTAEAPAGATEPPATQPAAASGAKPTPEPQWPERPKWLGGGQSNGLPFLNRPAAPQGGIEALWAQSNAEVVNPAGPSKPATGVQPCVSCGLSLSATAKFCRRCGTHQTT
jgi:hypothetical protein